MIIFIQNVCAVFIKPLIHRLAVMTTCACARVCTCPLNVGAMALRDQLEKTCDSRLSIVWGASSYGSIIALQTSAPPYTFAVSDPPGCRCVHCSLSQSRIGPRYRGDDCRSGRKQCKNCASRSRVYNSYKSQA